MQALFYDKEGLFFLMRGLYVGGKKGSEQVVPRLPQDEAISFIIPIEKTAQCRTGVGPA